MSGSGNLIGFGHFLFRIYNFTCQNLDDCELSSKAKLHQPLLTKTSSTAVQKLNDYLLVFSFQFNGVCMSVGTSRIKFQNAQVIQADNQIFFGC